MALDRQNVPIPFVGGMDTKTDPKQVPAAKLALLKNGTFVSPGRIKKRDGYTAMGTALGSTATGLATFKDELLAFTETDLYSWDPGTDASANRETPRWVSRDKMPGVYCTKRQIHQEATQVFDMVDVAVLNGLECYVWHKTGAGAGVYYSIVDTATGNFVVRNELAAIPAIGATPDYRKPRVIGCGSAFCVFYVGDDLGGDRRLYFRPISTTTPTVLGAESELTVTVASTLSTDELYDVATLNGFFYWVFTSATQMFAGRISTAGVKGPIKWSALETADQAIAIFGDPTTTANVNVAWSNNDTGDSKVRFAQFDSTLNLSETVAPQDAATFSGGACTSIAATAGLTTGIANLPTIDIYCSIAYGSNDWEKKVECCELVYLLGVWSGSTFTVVPSAVLASKPIVRGNVAHVGVYNVYTKDTINASVTSTQASRWILSAVSGGTDYWPRGESNKNFTINARLSYALAARPSGILPCSAVYANDTLHVVGLDDTENGYAMVADTIEFDSPRVRKTVEIGNGLHVTGGFLGLYDGQNFYEHGFHLYPPQSVGLAAGSGTNVYQYCCVYEHTDAQGQLHRSAPSFPFSHSDNTPISGGNTKSLSGPMLAFTDQPVGSTRIAIYRTAANLPVFYRLGSVANVPTTATWSYTDNTADADLITAAMLYTTGGVLECMSPGPCSDAVIFKNRVLVLSSQDPLRIDFSKVVLNNEPAEFNDALYIVVPPAGGPVTGLATLNDKLIVFKEDRAFYMAGSGPDNFGTNNDFTDLFAIPTDVGCIDSRSIQSSPSGVFFQSAKGIYQLDQSLNASYVGAPVEHYNSATITSATLVPTNHQARFTVSGAGADYMTVLVYDYLVGQWSVFDGMSAVDSVIWNRLYVHMNAAGNVYKQTPGVFSDAGSWIPLVVKTAWIQLAGLQAFQRIRRLALLGDYVSPHALSVELRYDFNNGAASQTASIAVASQPDLEQYLLHLTQQKCEAFQVTISDSAGDTVGEGLSLSGITVEGGAKRGLNKFPATKQTA